MEPAERNEPWARPRPGMVLSGCVLERVLERGFLGTLWQAFETDRDRPVAVKILHPVLACGEELRPEDRNLAEALSRVRHPGVVRIHRVGEEGPFRYLVREFVSGHRLDQLLRQDQGAIHTRPGRDWSQVVDAWGWQIARALGHCHELGLLHRALWPGNVGIGHDGKARIFDFWIGAVASPVGVTCLRGYLSPEEEWGGPVGPRSDLFSLGVVLYRCLAGTLPYPVLRTPSEDKVFFDRRPRPIRHFRPSVDRSLEAVVLKALELDPNQRFGSAYEMAEALQASSAGDPDWGRGATG